MQNRREFTVALVNVGLTQVDVELDGDLIGSAHDMPHARRPRTWLPLDRDGQMIRQAKGTHQMFLTGQQAALALVDHELDRRMSERIVAALEGGGDGESDPGRE